MSASSRLVPLSVLVLLAACGVSENQYAAVREGLAGSPALQQRFMAECTAKTAAESAAERNNVAAVMNVPVARVPQVYCQRMMGGVISGRLTREDINKADLGIMTPNLIRVVQGRR